MNHFNRDDKVWLSPYHEGDTVLFRSRSGFDTLVVKECYYNDTYVPFFFSTARNVMNAYSYVDMKVIHENDSLMCMLALEREDDGTRISFNFDHNLEKGNKADIVLKHMRIGKDDYNDIVFCTGKSSIYPSKNIEHYYWSKSKGLVQYKYQSGETYSIYKILPNKKGKKKCASSILPVNAQNISINYLIENTWFDIDDSPRGTLFIDTLRVTFDKKNIFFFQHTIVEHPVTKEIIDKSGESASSFYLSDTIPQRFDKTKVGKSTSGKYLVLLNDSSNYSDYYVWELNIKDSSTLEFTLSKFPLEDYIDSIGRKILLKKGQ